MENLTDDSKINIHHTELQLLVQNYAYLNIIIDLLIDIKTNNDDLQKKELFKKIDFDFENYKNQAQSFFVIVK